MGELQLQTMGNNHFENQSDKKFNNEYFSNSASEEIYKEKSNH